MLRELGLASILIIAGVGAAGAQSNCGDPPIAPEIPGAVDIQSKSPADADAAQHGAFSDIRRWQGALKSYRDCLTATIDTDKRSLGEAARSDKPDKKKMDQLQQDITTSNQAYDSSVDQEEKVVNEFHAVQVAYCARNDVNRASCPKT
jgi:hypothetical protein